MSSKNSSQGNEFGMKITPDTSLSTLVLVARLMAEMAAEVIIDKVGTPYRFPTVDEVSCGQHAHIMADTERYLRRRVGNRSHVDTFVWNSMLAAKVARDYAARAEQSGKSTDRVRVWRAYLDAARWSRLARA
ncbi:hypothetical protein Q8791_23670 [Nocardiopsis sp. CT-R113]|uniref:Uncharacterized protein n=1 Tax=Nocardiopsis codii TaxID=3065942 RepID=A0ABU7KDA9_9ACTN|nr:hypothetical protein [Nocardiopsis sp. CT-R113]MEE2040219.1 hypothetical protein [Nocardiopsis sp. CT-R113]